MKIFPQKGIENILFGMKPKNIETVLGKPNKTFADEDQNEIYLYDQLKLSLTFYEEEDFKLGYITTTDKDVTVFGQEIIGQTVVDAKKSISEISSWDFEDFDNFEHHFNEDNWIILVSEFNVITKIEIGAIIVNDEFLWPFKS